MVVILVIVHYVTFNPILALIMTFVTGAIAFSLAAPIQMLMINAATGSEMIAASVSQASFNIGNALGAFFGGLPLVYGYDYTSPAAVGAAMALIGALFALWLIMKNNAMRRYSLTISKA
jgi:DHA1 family arabinose polymer transporter-like MFS transporter